jgi:hypothetical protein
MHQRMYLREHCTPAMRQIFLLACMASVVSVRQAGGASAAYGTATRNPRGVVARPAVPGPRAVGGPHVGGAHVGGAHVGLGPARVPSLGHPPGVQHGPATPGHGLTGAGHNPAGQGHGPVGAGAPGPGHAPPHNTATLGRPALNPVLRNGLPYRPFPGETGFSGVPPRGEARFVSSEMVVHVGADVSPQALDAAARRLGLTSISSQSLSLSGGRLVHFRIANGQQVPDAVRALEAEKIGIAQPNYVFHLQQDSRAAAPVRGDLAQYVVDKLHLLDAHGISSGTNVPVAVIDSLVDVGHPDLAGSIAGQFDAVTSADRPDEHGTGMTGAIVAHRKLLGVAPRARILAIHAFSPDSHHPQQATTQSIVAGIDWAISKGARVINMSFAGPYDPMLQLALKKAHDKGVVLIAAAGNIGPQSPPLYPAADENVIAVTAVDENDKLMPQANQGPHIALAAPGVNVIEAAPGATYNFTTGTSVAAAHVSGVAALILERNPTIDLAALENALFSTARDLGAPGRDSLFGYGLVDPFRALNALEAKMAVGRGQPGTTAASNATPATMGATSGHAPPGAAILVSGAPAGPIGPAATAALPAPGPASTPPAALTLAPLDLDGSPVAIERKRLACRQDAAARGVRATDLANYIAACVNEARLTCLKQVAAQRLRGPERRDFLDRCLLGAVALR